MAVTGGALLGQTVNGVTAGADHTCAWTSFSAAMCWGFNDAGQIGLPLSEQFSSVPVVVTGGALTGAAVFGGRHTCTPTFNFIVCWGANEHGQVGIGIPMGVVPTPSAIMNGALSGQFTFVIAATADHNCAMTGDGALACWGANAAGQIGDGTTTDAGLPVAIPALVQNLAVVRTGTGTGTVTSSSPGLSCGGACEAAFSTKAHVTLHAAPAGGSTFAGWSGGGCFGTADCTVTLQTATQVSAQFTLALPPPTTTPILTPFAPLVPARVFAPLVPARLLDSRFGAGTADGLLAGVGLRAAGSVSVLPVAGRGGVMAGAAAVVLTVTVSGARDAGFVTVFPCGSAVPNASNVNFATGETIANAVVVGVGARGAVCLYTSAATDLIVDVTGSFRPARTRSPADLGAADRAMVATPPG